MAPHPKSANNPFGPEIDFDEITPTPATASALATHTGDTSNPHAVDAADVFGTMVEIDDTDSPYTVAAGVGCVWCETKNGAITVNMPAASGSGRVIEVKNVDITAVGNDVTVTPDGADKIDGNATWTLSAAAGPPIALDAATLQDGASGSWMVR